MFRRFVALIIPVLLVLGSGVAAAQDATPGSGATPTVFVRQDPTLGKILTDPAGKTLYQYKKDTTPNQSSCTDKCIANWPAFTATEPLTLPSGVDGELTTFTRSDGGTQVAYNGIPLYYFVKDTQPGDTNGQGIGDVWYVVAPGAKFGQVTASPAAGATPPPVASPKSEYDVTVALTEFTLNASTTEFEVGEEYTFDVTNAGQFPHELVLEKAGANDEPLDGKAEVGPLDSGTNGSFTYTFSEPGTYQLTCHVRDHYTRGMALTIHVK